jgi:hypothetical protein
MWSALIAALAAMAATLGDLLMLYVANSRRPELLLPEVSAEALWVGAALGVLGIPVYALGYHAASRMLGPVSRRSARAVFLLGSLGAAIGAGIHALTALQIQSDLEAGAPALDPIEAVASWGPTLPALWAMAAALVVSASLIFGWRVGRGGGPAPRFLGLANPALITVALVGVGMTTPLLRAFLAPAAPNVAHVLFFAACAWAQYGRSSGLQPT